jgi:hypothetical protein
MKDYQPWDFTCKTCGDHRLTVSRIWLTLAGPGRERWQEWGPLKGNHLWQFKFREKIEKEIDQNKDDEVRRWDFGGYTEDSSSSKPEENKIFKQESYPVGDKFYVNCAGCEREIEFGWSQPNRGGRIYPVECSDFIPGNVWPDPKYADVWKQRAGSEQDIS